MVTSPEIRLRLDEVEKRVCDIASQQLGIRRDQISPQDRLFDDLGCESLDMVELFMELEETFRMTLPDNPLNPVCKSVFSRQPFRLADLAEMVYLQQGTGRPDRRFWLEERPQPSSQQKMRYGRHRRGTVCRADTLPMADVNAELGMSPFGLHHMAGNVWQWCRDWYDEGFYTTSESTRPDLVNLTPAKVKSERGGSWIGPPELCRTSYRRGRPPFARGRCLGFRCMVW